MAEPTRSERPNWRKLTPEEATDLARELVHVHRATIGATALLVRAGGIRYGEASAQVQQFEQEEIGLTNTAPITRRGFDEQYSVYCGESRTAELWIVVRDWLWRE